MACLCKITRDEIAENCSGAKGILSVHQYPLARRLSIKRVDTSALIG